MPRPTKPDPVPATVKAYIEQDPDSLGFAAPWAAGNNTAVVDLLNQPRTDAFVPRSSRELLSFSASNGIFDKILAGTKSADARAAGICEAAMIMIRREDTELDLADPDHLAMASALKAAGVLNDANETALLAFCQAKVGQFEADYGRQASLYDVRNARNA